jgi:phosphonate transport system permease protein
MECLDRVGLADYAGRRVDTLSGGQQQRVAIARMLMQRPRVILADEPVASLDPASSKSVMDLMCSIAAESWRHRRRRAPSDRAGPSIYRSGRRTEKWRRGVRPAGPRLRWRTAGFDLRRGGVVSRRSIAAPDTSDLPARVRRPSLLTLVIVLVVGGLLVHGWTQGATVRPDSLATGVFRLGEFVQDAVPPDVNRLGPILKALLVTVEMALLGTIIGVILSLPLAVLAALNTTPHWSLYAVSRAIVTVSRTIPDLVWGLIFVIAVGLGPEAGVLAIAVDVMGFCGRFFAESIEDMDPGRIEGLRALGAPRFGVLAGGVIPACLPSFVTTSMFALESAARSSVVLGLVGAGGIGIELATSMTLLRYDEAATIIQAILGVVVVFERVSAAIRRRVLGG